MRRVAVLLFTVIPLVSPQFLNPSQRREVWRIGETKKVTYNTKLKNYTIALWQQAIAGGSAELGPIIVDTTDGPEREFEWKVDLEMLDLGASNIFFFWFFEGDRSIQGHTGKGDSFSSAFFNITDEPAAQSSSITKTSTTQTTSSTSSAISSSLTEQSTTDQPVPSTTATDTSSTAQDRSTPAATAPGPTDKTKAEDGSVSNTASVSAEPAELPVGAQAGIGVGVGLVGVTCIICVVLWYKYLKRKSHTMCELQGTPCLPKGPSGRSRNWLTGEQTPESPVDRPGYYVNRRPVEAACD